MTKTNGPVYISELARKTKEVFGDMAIDKRRLPRSQLQGRGMPGYVGEWVLDYVVPGDGPLLTEEYEKAQEWADRYAPGITASGRIKHRLLQGKTVKLLTPLQVEIILQRKKKDTIAKLPLLGFQDAHIAEHLLNEHQTLLDREMWGVVELISTGEGVAVVSFRPMQAVVNLNLYKEARREFSLPEWRALLLLSMGYDPAELNDREQTLLLCRLLPLIQKSLHLLELAPKGTGKS